MYPTIIPINIDESFKNPLNCLRTSITIITVVPTNKWFNEPKSLAPAPPPKYLIPTGNKDKPIDIITKLVTIGGNNFLSGFIKNPKIASIIPPTKPAPIIAPYPYCKPIACAVPINPELVPITIGSFAPTGPIGYNCTSVIKPAINIAF